MEFAAGKLKVSFLSLNSSFDPISDQKINPVSDYTAN